MEPTDFEYGERQYTAEDHAGHQWTFSETLADVAPEEWGGETVLPGLTHDPPIVPASIQPRTSTRRRSAPRHRRLAAVVRWLRWGRRSGSTQAGGMNSGSPSAAMWTCQSPSWITWWW